MKHEHTAILEKVRGQMPGDTQLEALAELFKSFGDRTRMKILFALFECDLCVCAISELLSMEQSAISHQLKKLKEAKLVDSRREGKTMIYFLADDHVKTIVSMGFAHLTEDHHA